MQRSLDRRWFSLLPAVFITYSLAYLDRANFGFGTAAGLAYTLHISDRQVSLLGSLFFLGYFVFQVPGVILARRIGMARLIFFMLIAWGIFAAATGVLRTFWMLAADRILLGMAESLIFPAMVHLLTNWFTRAERSRANTLLIFGNPVTVLWMSVLTGYLIQAIGWQKTFIAEGLPTLAWACCWLLLVRDKPAQARWMQADAAEWLELALHREQLQVERVGSVGKALARPDVWLLAAQYFCWSVGVYGFVLWLPTMVRHGAALSMGRTGLLSAVPYVCAVVLMAVVAFISDKTRKRAALVWPFLLGAGLALLMSFFVAQRHFPAAFCFLVIGGGCMYAPYGPFFALVPERLPANVTAEVFALINSCGALGGFLGSYGVGLLQAATGRSQAGFMLMSIALISAAILTLLLPPHAATTPANPSPPQSQ